MAKIVTKGNIVGGIVAIAMLALFKRFAPALAQKAGV